MRSRGKNQLQLTNDPVGEEKEDSLQVDVKTVDAQRYYYVSQKETLAALLPNVGALAVRLNMNLVKSGGTADGPVVLLGLPGEELRLALPTRGAPQPRGRYRLYSAPAFKCAWLRLRQGEGDAEAMATAFRERVADAGYRLTGEYRLEQVPGDNAVVELQLGVE